MAEGMEVDSTPAVRDKKRFEVKKVRVCTKASDFLVYHFLLPVECSRLVVMG